MLKKFARNAQAYLDKSFKAAANAPMKTTAINGAAAGVASLGGEIYDYGKADQPKALTKENLYQSISTIFMLR